MTEKELNERLKQKQFIIELIKICNQYGFYVDGEVFESHGNKVYYEDMLLDYEGKDYIAPIFLDEDEG